MYTYFVNSHVYNDREQAWNAVTSCTSADTIPQATDIVVRHLLQNYSQVRVVSVKAR